MTLLLDVKRVHVATQEETVLLTSMNVTIRHVILTAPVSTSLAHSGVTAKMDTPKPAQLHAKVGGQFKL